MKGKGILDRKGTDQTVRKQGRKKATFYCSFVSLNRRYLVEVSIGNLFFLCDCETPVLAARTLYFLLNLQYFSSLSFVCCNPIQGNLIIVTTQLV